MPTNTLCNSLDKLSAEGNWDDVFFCLQIDANSTIELANLRVPHDNEDDTWLDKYKATANSLEVILAIILLFDQIFYIALLWYLIMFACKLLRHRGFDALRRLRSSISERRIKPKSKCKLFKCTKLNPLSAAVSVFGSSSKDPKEKCEYLKE